MKYFHDVDLGFAHGSFNQLFEEAKSIADQLSCTAKFKFNGVTVSVTKFSCLDTTWVKVQAAIKSGEQSV